jgi:hypothetical protein
LKREISFIIIYILSLPLYYSDLSGNESELQTYFDFLFAVALNKAVHELIKGGLQGTVRREAVVTMISELVVSIALTYPQYLVLTACHRSFMKTWLL